MNTNEAIRDELIHLRVPMSGYVAGTAWVRVLLGGPQILVGKPCVTAPLYSLAMYLLLLMLVHKSKRFMEFGLNCKSSMKAQLTV
jgi:hypothetical protein